MSPGYSTLERAGISVVSECVRACSASTALCPVGALPAHSASRVALLFSSCSSHCHDRSAARP